VQKSKLPGSERYYGWKPSLPDLRDLHYHAPAHVMASLPPAVDLSAGVGPVLNQGQIGSCGPNSSDSLIMFDQQKQSLPVASVSRLLIYYYSRLLMGTVQQDSGVNNRDMLKALNQYGFCDESLWPYDTIRFTSQPPAEAVKAAAPNKIQSYAVVNQTLGGVKGCLASGFPFLFGFTVYESFESQEVANTGIVPMPQRSERSVGGHDVVICGYDDITQRFKFKNSWGSWGMGGFGYFPYAYVLDPNLSGDFWVVNAIPSGAPGPTPTPPEQELFSLDFRRQAVPAGGLVRFTAKKAIPAAIVDLVVRTGAQAEEYTAD
jgi:C1A family cysteine protease